MKRLSDQVSRLTRNAASQRGFTEGRLLTEWPLIVGPALAAYTCPIRIRYPDKNAPQGVLVVHVEGAWGLEVRHLEPVILERITTFLGYPGIRGLKIQQVPVGTLSRHSQTAGDGSQKNVAKSFNAPENLTLDAALEQLGRAVRNKQTNTR